VYIFERVISSPVGEAYQTRVSEKVRVPQSVYFEKSDDMVFSGGYYSK
jgi:hypothetical protein